MYRLRNNEARTLTIQKKNAFCSCIVLRCLHVFNDVGCAIVYIVMLSDHQTRNSPTSCTSFHSFYVSARHITQRFFYIHHADDCFHSYRRRVDVMMGTFSLVYILPSTISLVIHNIMERRVGDEKRCSGFFLHVSWCTDLMWFATTRF